MTLSEKIPAEIPVEIPGHSHGHLPRDSLSAHSLLDIWDTVGTNPTALRRAE